MQISEPTHVVHLLDEQARRTPEHPALSWLVGDCVYSLTWAEYRHQVRALATRFLAWGVQPGETVAILAPNILEHYVADLATVLCGGATVSLYPTLVDEQLAHILADARPVVVVVADPAAAERLQRLLPEGTEARIVCAGGRRR